MSLIQRLEALTGPDREVDLELWWACKANNSSGLPMDPDYKAHNLKMNDAPRYTSSIDAALTLVMDGMCYSLGLMTVKIPKGDWGLSEFSWARVHKIDRLGECVEHKNQAIALCLASLKARGVK